MVFELLEQQASTSLLKELFVLLSPRKIIF
jgi:hypothetical protein